MNQKTIKSINNHISDSLKQLGEVVLLADSNEWSFHLNYSEEDALNVLFIFNHILSNIGIKNGTLDSEEKGEEVGDKLRLLVKDMIGIDGIELANRVLKDKKK